MAGSEFNCPLCKQQNLCGINSVEPCWCLSKKLPAELIDQVPIEQLNKSCICENCVDKFNLLIKEAE